jgi:hypothetical protein
VRGWLFHANLAVLAFHQMFRRGVLTWGWRACRSCLSAVLVCAGFVDPARILDNAWCSQARREKKNPARADARASSNANPKEILLSAFARMGEQAPFYSFTARSYSPIAPVTCMSRANFPAHRVAGRLADLVLL